MQLRRDSSRWPDVPVPWLALAVSVAVAVSMLTAAKGGFLRSLGDTDDAMRLVMVRQLLSGESGWFELRVLRAGPPDGLTMHWSRLVDAGLAGFYRLFSLVMTPDRAELGMRVAWPLVWTLPAIWATLSIARRFGGAGATIVASAMLIVNLLLYVQWWPGRIDHHDIQITMALIALAGAVRGGRGGAAVAGVATGFGLAVGLEALAFLALAGASFALRFVFDPDREAAPARTYALTLLAATTLFYLAQTPPVHWGHPVCDALAANLWMALAVASGGLLVAVRLGARRSLGVRIAILGVVGALAGASYIALLPDCLHGPLGSMDPRLQHIWLDYIIEMQPLLHGFPKERSEFALSSLILMGLGAAAWLWLGRRREGRTAGWLLLGVCLAVGAAAAFDARRMAHYPSWFSIPLIAAALCDLSARLKRPLVPAIAAACLLSPPAITSAMKSISSVTHAPVAPTAPRRTVGSERCSERASYGRLAMLPTSLVLGEVDIGPYVLAETRDNVIATPYHRMSRGILAGNDALAAHAGPDEGLVRRLGVAYVLDCPARSNQLNHVNLGPASLQMRLDRGEAPAWLERVSDPKAPLQIYRVLPPAPSGPPPPASTSLRVR
jgi:hypothetical protein